MSIYALTSLAKADIFEIWSYIADDNEPAADRVEQAIYNACAFVAADPLRGHLRLGLTGRSLRFWTLTRYPNYAVVYRPDTTPDGSADRQRQSITVMSPESIIRSSDVRSFNRWTRAVATIALSAGSRRVPPIAETSAATSIVRGSIRHSG